MTCIVKWFGRSSQSEYYFFFFFLDKPFFDRAIEVDDDIICNLLDLNSRLSIEEIIHILNIDSIRHLISCYTCFTFSYFNPNQISFQKTFSSRTCCVNWTIKKFKLMNVRFRCNNTIPSASNSFYTFLTFVWFYKMILKYATILINTSHH